MLVRPDGFFSFPLAGEVEAVGKTIDEIRMDITEKLQRYISDTVVTVSAMQIGGNKVYVIGQVSRPGEFLVCRQIACTMLSSTILNGSV